MRKIFVTILLVLIASATITAQESTKKERNYIRSGNSYYNDKRYADAEVQYRKALEENPTSEVGQFNLASSLIRQSGAADPNNGKNPIEEAKRIMTNLAQGAQNKSVKEHSFYNLGNMAFNVQDYQQSIEMYKNALRVNPDNDKARQNLRLAQLRLQEQQQDKDKNKDQNKDQQDQKDKQDNQDKQDQNKDQQDKNKDKDKKDDQNQPQPQDKKDDNKQRQQQNQNGISEQNAEQILKALDNQENATRQRVNAQMKKAEQSSRNNSRHKW